MRDTLIFWRDVPMDVDLGSFEYIAENWGGRIVVICFSDYPPERKMCGWDFDKLENVHNIILPEIVDPDRFLKKLIEDNPNAIHIFNGIRGRKQRYLDFCIKNNSNVKLGVISERPSLFGNELVLLAKKAIFHMLYGALNLKYRKFIACFFPLGEIGSVTYQSYGWDKEILFPYMYNPKLASVIKSEVYTDKTAFLYVGRFDADAKGLDILMKAVDGLPQSSTWSLDLVGGYGAIKEEVIHWCQTRQNVHFLGTWKNDELCAKMCDYDVCLVPSKYDGWNLTPNQAIHCGIGTIITNQAGSDELIRCSGAGLVVNANSVTELHEAMLFAIEHYSEVEAWKQNACNYRNKISPETVGQYFIDTMDFAFKKEGKRPICPWTV